MGGDNRLVKMHSFQAIPVTLIRGYFCLVTRSITMSTADTLGMGEEFKYLT